MSSPLLISTKSGVNEGSLAVVAVVVTVVVVVMEFVVVVVVVAVTIIIVQHYQKNVEDYCLLRPSLLFPPVQISSHPTNPAARPPLSQVSTGEMSDAAPCPPHLPSSHYSPQEISLIPRRRIAKKRADGG